MVCLNKIKQKLAQSAYSLVELLMAIAIFGVLTTILFTGFIATRDGKPQHEAKMEAAILYQETIEALRIIREQDWENIAHNGTYHPQTTADSWTLVGGGKLINEITGLTRSVVIDDVYRDQDGNMTNIGGIIDPSTKAITVNITWDKPLVSSYNSTIYLTRHLDNLAFSDSTVEDFQSGEMDLVKTVSPILDDGEIQLVGGCPSGSPESLIYDNKLQNDWLVNCDGLPFWLRIFCRVLQIVFSSNTTINTNSSEYTYNNSSRSIKLTFKPPSIGSSWSWGRIYNYNGVCTVGFRDLSFYVYNPSSVESSFYVTAVYSEWDTKEVLVPPREWKKIVLDYEEINESYEKNLTSIFFSSHMSAGDPEKIIFIDGLELTGGIGGFFQTGTFVSSTFDASRNSAFNRISFNGEVPADTLIGFQTAATSSSNGPWIFTGPNNTSLDTDLYLNPIGESLYFQNNMGRYFKYKAFLKSSSGINTPIIYDVTINYSP